MQRGRVYSWYLTKYVLLDFLGGFFSGTAIFLFIMLSFQVIRLADFVVEHQVALWLVGKLAFSMLVSFVSIAMPIAFLFAVLMGISRANSEGEILAMQANGVSLPQIYFPVSMFSILVTIVSLYCSFYSAPQGNRRFELLITKIGNEKAMAALKPGVFMEGFYGLTVFAEQLLPMKNELKRVFLYDEREEAHPLAITAQEGILRNDMEKGILTLRLTNGSILPEKKEPGGIQQKINFDVYDINLETAPPAGEAWRAYSPESYTYEQLRDRITETKQDLVVHRKLQVEMHRRFAMAFACFVFGALGFFIGITSSRGIRSTAILLCLLVAVCYWLSFLVANMLAVSGWVLPWIGVWAPNVVFLALSYWLYRRAAYP